MDLLDAVVAVRSVMTAYMAACDAHDAGRVAALFEEGAQWTVPNAPDAPTLLGIEAIRAEYAVACARLTFCTHYLADERIEVHGDAATGRWSYFEPATNRGELAVWTAGRYHHDFARTDGIWRFRRFRIAPVLAAPYDVGWVPDPMVPLQ